MAYTVYTIATGVPKCWGMKQAHPEEGQAAIEGVWPNDFWRIWDGVPVSYDSSQDPVDLESLKSELKHEISSWLDAQGDLITGDVPKNEKLTYDAKEAAAIHIAAGTATSEEMSLIEIEAALVGETVEVTVTKIMTNAALFRVAGPLITGIRRRGFAAMDAATTVAEVEGILASCQALYLEVLQDPLGFAADPVGWLAQNA